MAQIMVTPFPDPSVRNLKSDKATTPEQAKKKIQMIEERLKKNEDFSMLAQNYSEDPNSSPNGGDLGFISESALEKANADLRKLVMSLTPGQTSQVMTTPDYSSIVNARHYDRIIGYLDDARREGATVENLAADAEAPDPQSRRIPPLVRAVDPRQPVSRIRAIILKVIGDGQKRCYRHPNGWSIHGRA